MKRILFILKRRQDYSTDIENFSKRQVATGMYNSARFVSDMLTANGVQAHVCVVVDNNDIDREVAAFRPTDVIIEGLWVVPEKFETLCRLHPRVRWTVRIHSELPFLSQEGVAMEWIFEYLKHRHVFVSANSFACNRELQEIRPDLKDRIIYLPNYYPISDSDCQIWRPRHAHHHMINIGCFGALRPLKNQLIQAVAALRFAAEAGVSLNFHINVGANQHEGSILRNLRALFANVSQNANLIEHSWTSHDQFIQTLSGMDACMQVSLSESFNIVSADATLAGVPIVVSKEIAWAFPLFADPTSVASIQDTLCRVLEKRSEVVEENRARLRNFSSLAERTWLYNFG